MRQKWSLVAEAIVAAEVGYMMGDVADPAPTISVPSIVKKYGLDWGGYKQGKKVRSAAAQHLRTALYRNPHLTATNDRVDRFVLYTLKRTPE